MPWAALGSAVGGIAGNVMSHADAQEALAMQQQMLQNIQNINTPEAHQLMLALKSYQDAGQLSPQMESLISQGPSQMSNIQTDPRLMNAAMQSLQTLQKTGSGALRPEDMAALDQIRDASNNQAQAQKQSILQSMAARGLGGSGAELAAQLSAGQNAANRANEQDQQVGANASQRALQAIAQAGNLGASLQGQQFSQQAQQASAQDAINRYNAMNAQQVGNTNVQQKNAAQQYNLANLQNIMNQNTGVANQQATYNAQVPQQVFQNQLAKATGAQPAGNALSNAYNKNAANTQSMYAGLGRGIGQAASALSKDNSDTETYYGNDGQSSEEEQT
jgi:hypothetical protein